jgi:hypothetical protein
VDVAVELRHLGSPFLFGEREDAFAEVAEYEKAAPGAVERPAELRVRPSPVHPIDQHRLRSAVVGDGQLFGGRLKQLDKSVGDLGSPGGPAE